MLKSRSFLKCFSMSCLVFVHSSLSITVVGSSPWLCTKHEMNQLAASKNGYTRLIWNNSAYINRRVKDLMVKDHNKDTNCMNYLESIPIITDDKQIVLSVPFSPSWSCDLYRKESESSQWNNRIRRRCSIFWKLSYTWTIFWRKWPNTPTKTNIDIFLMCM